MAQVLILQIPEKMAKALNEEKEESGVPKSEIVRRAIKEYLEK